MSQLSIDQAWKLAQAHHEAGRLGEAEAMYRQVLAAQPNHAGAMHDLGVLAAGVGRADVAADLIGRAAVIEPGNAAYHSHLGNMLVKLGRIDQALISCRRAVNLDRESAGALNNLGMALKESGEIDEALVCFEEALKRGPNQPEILHNLGLILHDVARLEQAIACYRKALLINPRRIGTHDTLLLAMLYHDGSTAEELLEESQRWDRLHAQIGEPIAPHVNDASAQRRLRIGYVSGDFRSHAVARFLLQWLGEHDTRAFEVFAYSNVRQPDAITARLRSMVGHWIDITRLNDEQAAEQIRRDRIDILVDLAGHTVENRLLIFARKPAPVQVSYLGYAASTGLRAIGYRITDSLADPPGLTERLHTEKLIRLEGSNWCFCPFEGSPKVRELPASRNRFVTFGSLNNFAKLNAPLLDWWMKILRMVPGSRLLIKAKGLQSEAAQRLVRQRMKKSDIATDRVEMIGWLGDAEHFELFSRIDIGLESYPYHGTTTTCESLWMGVPVVTLAGCSHVSRVGVSLLSSIGFPELIGESPEQYIQIAAELAGNFPRLSELRASLREKMRRSVLTDGAAFARGIEAAYREIWQTWRE